MTEQTTRQHFSYPVTDQGNTVDTYFGTEVADPYRWLEDDMSPKTSAWIDAQNDVTERYLAQADFRQAIHDKLKVKYLADTLGMVYATDGYLYFGMLSVDRPQPVIYREPIAGGEREVFLDVNECSEDGTTSLSGMAFSHSKEKVACIFSDGGSDWTRVQVRDVSSREVIDENVTRMKFSGVSWEGDKAFYYSTYDDPEGSKLSARTHQHRVYRHVLGQHQTQDTLMYGADSQRTYRYASIEVSKDQQWLILYGANDTSTNTVWFKPLTQPDTDWRSVCEDEIARIWVEGNVGETFYLQTDLSALNGRLVTVTATAPDIFSAKDIIAESDAVIEQIEMRADGFLVSSQRDVLTQVQHFGLDGRLRATVDLPANGSVEICPSEFDSDCVFIKCADLSTPTLCVQLSTTTGDVNVRFESTLPFDANEYESKQVFFTSKDGTRVPMFIAYKKGTELNGQNPTLLYGYGGFNISVPPVMAGSIAAWLELGGVYVQANIRGGGEYGKAWHLAGTKLQKQNVFDDFIASAEHLIASGYCSASTLAIRGGSNGGLLVGACMTQRPELFCAAFPAVGVLDMLRYHEFTSGAGWAYDYGTAHDSAEMFHALYSYSPLHSVKEGVVYPATLITTGDHDDRVVPAHSFKFAAELQVKGSDATPLMIRVNRKAGHGAGKSLTMVIDELTDIYTFSFMAMNRRPAG